MIVDINQRLVLDKLQREKMRLIKTYFKYSVQQTQEFWHVLRYENTYL